MTSLEFRQIQRVEYRMPDGGRRGQILADVMKYNKIDDYRTSFAPGVFTDSLSDHLPKIAWGHNMLEPIGQWIDADDNHERLRLLGQLDLDMVETDDGRMLDIPAVPMAHRAYTQLRNRTIDQFSVGFLRLADSPHREVRGATQIDKAWLDEASPVLTGSVPGAELVGVRSRNTLQESVLLERGRRRVFNMETRANPVGYNQYKHGSGGGGGGGGGGVTSIDSAAATAMSAGEGSIVKVQVGSTQVRLEATRNDRFEVTNDRTGRDYGRVTKYGSGFQAERANVDESATTHSSASMAVTHLVTVGSS